MIKTEPRTLAGFMELMPNEQILFEQIKQKIEKTYQKFGFLPLDTPILELSEVLLAKAGGETEKQIYRFEKGDTDISMRFDLTVPLAKYVAKNYGNLSFPFRRYQIGKVYRGERTQKGRFREFYQCDIDIIGDGELSIINDAELPSVIYNVFKELGFDNFTIKINNRKLFNGLFESLNQKENAVEIVEDIALNSKMETAVLFKNGDISVYNNTEENYVYKARENDTADYVSLVTEITYDDEDRLYMCDTGLREIYRMSSGYTGKETVISRGKFASAKSDNFSEQPLYTGLSVYGTNVSVLVAEYRYEQETDEEIYTYNIAQVSDDGNTQFCIGRIRASVFQCIRAFAVYLALLVLIVIAVYFIIKLVRFLRNIELEKSVKIQLIMVITALGVTMGVSYVIFDSCNSRFIDEVADKLLNVSYLIGESVDKQILSEIKSPDDYYTDDYKKLDESVNKVIKSKANKNCIPFLATPDKEVFM